MTMFLSEGSLLIRSLGWTLLHSLWQGALIAMCLWIVLKTVANAAARVKYHLSLSALLLMSGWFIITWVQQWQRLKLLTVVVTEAGKDAAVQKIYTLSALPQQGPAELWVEQWFPNMDFVFPWIVGMYAAGMCFMLLRFTVGFGKLWRLRINGISAPEPALLDWMQQLKDKMEIPGNVRLALSSRITMPMMMGVIKPLILLPFSMTTALSTPELEAILLHELAHIKRRDFLVNILQIIIETILFFNPFMWWISAGIRREREHCCDDLVISHTLQPLPYAKALATLEANRFASDTFAMAAAGKKHHLFHRIKRITEMKKTQLNYGRLVAALLMVGILTFSLIWFTPGFAQTNKNKKKDSNKEAAIHRITYIDANGVYHDYDSTTMPPDVKTVMAQLMKKLPGATQQPKDGTSDSTGLQAASLDNYDASGEDPADPGEPVCPPQPSAQEDFSWNAMDTEELREKLREDLKNADNVDWAAIGGQMADAKRAADQAMKSVDWKQVNKQMRDAERQMKKVQEQMKKDMKDINWKEINGQMDEARKKMEEARRQLRDASNGYGIKLPVNVPGRMYRLKNRVPLNDSDIPPMPPVASMSPMPSVPAFIPTPPTSSLAPVAVMPTPYYYTTTGVRAYRDGKPYHNVRVNRNGSQVSVTVDPNPDKSKEHTRKTTTTTTSSTRTTTVTSIGGVEQLDDMLKEMETEGLIEKNGHFTINRKDGRLFINGKEQNAAVQARYKKHFKVDRVSISGTRNYMVFADESEQH